MQLPGDFSNFDHPVSEMFHFPISTEELDQYTLTDKKVLTVEMEGRFFPLLSGYSLKK
jgi:hypothetical protein